MIWTAPAERSGDGALCPTNFSLSFRLESKSTTNDKLKFVGQSKAVSRYAGHRTPKARSKSRLGQISPLN